MDTSGQYVKMSLRARKFLPEHIWQDGDWAYGDVGGKMMVYIFYSGYWTDAVPLLRQDQLQAMIIKDDAIFERWGVRIGDSKTIWLLQRLYDFACFNEQYLGSMEQLWLAFVMKEKYGKVWNSDKEEWVDF